MANRYIEWVGTFRELCEDTGEFPVKIRGSFLEGGDVVPQEMVEECGEYLRSCGF